MRSLSVEDMRRVVGSGDLFLLVDVRPLDVINGPSLPGAVRIPFGRDIASGVLTEVGQLSMPIVVHGDGDGCPIASDSARQLLEAGFEEVWTYCGRPEAWVPKRRQRPGRLNVVSDPDLGVHHSRDLQPAPVA